MVAEVLGGSLASIPSSAFESETMRRLMNISLLTPAPRLSGWSEEADIDVRKIEREANATDVTAVFNWWVAVVWLDIKFNRRDINQEKSQPKMCE